ncbi:MAG TPA: CHASE3 domain-containing protein [Candidatus Paceibacterota bacterium]|nr:CHASE3 domain-containing protein [Candidatus Paceibacterota bacterium]
MALIRRLKEKLINAVLILSLVAIFLAIIIICFQSMLRLTNNNLWQRHSYDVVVEINKLETDLLNAETGQCGYVITGLDVYLEPYDNALLNIDKDFQGLQELTKDNAVQQGRLLTMRPLIDAKLADLKNSIALRKDKGLNVAVTGVLTEKGKQIMDSIRVIMADIQTDEANLRQSRVNDTNQTIAMIKSILIWGGIIGLLFYLLVNYLINIFVMGNLVEKPLLAREKLALDEALKANKEMEAFSYSVSHDLRAPLRAIDGFTQILVEDYGEKLDDEGKRVASVIRTSTVQMGKLIDDLLSFSRLGRQEVNKNSVAMYTLADDVYKELKKATPEKDIEFIISKIPDTKADINMMRVVWTNLLSNAIKFTSKNEKPKIEVGSSSDNTTTTYFVKDNGAGFDMKYIAKLFGVFQRLHSSDEFEGTGVGLANVKRVIERHGGKVWAEGKVGEGATFYFTLPKI